MAAAADKAAADSGLVVVEAFHYRYHPLAHRMREIVESGELGRLHHIEAWLCAPIANKSDIRYQSELAGGAMMDMGCYVVHMARMLGGEEPSVTAASAKLHSPDVDRAMTAGLQFPSGHTATVHCSLWSSSLLHLSARVVGDLGELRVFNPIGPQYRQLAHRALRRWPAHRDPLPAADLRLPAGRVLQCRPPGSAGHHHTGRRRRQHVDHRCRVPCSQHAPTWSVNASPAKESSP